ncbi:hypothetical protein GW750_09430 [bacterium]|nr:hypothetical protein [bacterium]
MKLVAWRLQIYIISNMIEKKLNHRIISVILGHKDSDIPQEQEKKISDTNVDTS